MGVFSSIAAAIGSAVLSKSAESGGSALSQWMSNSAKESLAKNTLRTANAENWDMAVKQARELPTHTVAGLRAAGINPLLAYGGIPSAGQSWSAQGMSSSTPVSQPADFSGLEQAFNKQADTKGKQAENVVKESKLYQAGRIASSFSPVLSSAVSTAVGIGLAAKFLKQAGASQATRNVVEGFARQSAIDAGRASTVGSALSLGKLKGILKGTGYAALMGAAASGLNAWREHRSKVGGEFEKKILNTPAHVLMPLR